MHGELDYAILITGENDIAKKEQRRIAYEAAIVDDEWQCREQIAVAMDGIGGLELAKHILYLTKEKKDTIWQSPADVYQRGKICLIRDGGRNKSRHLFVL